MGRVMWSRTEKVCMYVRMHMYMWRISDGMYVCMYVYVHVMYDLRVTWEYITARQHMAGLLILERRTEYI